MQRRTRVIEELVVLLRRLASTDPAKFREVSAEILALDQVVHKKFTRVLDVSRAVHIMCTNDEGRKRTGSDK
jgi:hypothetical protein